MSVTICWRPALEVAAYFKHGTSSELQVLQNTFGQLPIDDIPMLRAMADASGSKFYNEVADVVEKYGAIAIWGEY